MVYTTSSRPFREEEIAVDIYQINKNKPDSFHKPVVLDQAYYSHQAYYSRICLWGYKFQNMMLQSSKAEYLSFLCVSQFRYSSEFVQKRNI